MLWYVLVGFLAAFGVLCLLWTLFGFLLPGSSRCRIAILCVKGREIATIRRFCLLRDFGLLRFELTVIDSALNGKQKRYIKEKYPFIHFCSWEDWLSGGEGGHKAIESGTRDSSGQHRCGGVSELR